MNTYQFLLQLICTTSLSACSATVSPLPVASVSPSPVSSPSPSPKPSPSLSASPSPSPSVSLTVVNPTYQTRGIGGGGAQYGVAFQPTSSLAFIATDMGTLFRSIDSGQHWTSVDQAQLHTYPFAQMAYAGFTGNPNDVFWVNNDLNAAFGNPTATGGYTLQAYVSHDQGITFAPMSLPLNPVVGTLPAEHVLYFKADLTDNQSAYCITDQGMLYTRNAGVTWTRSTGLPTGQGLGTFIQGNTVIHAVGTALYTSTNRGTSFSLSTIQPRSPVMSFAGGYDSKNGTTLAVLDTNGTQACNWTTDTTTQGECGYVWVSRNGQGFVQTSMIGGKRILMADNDSQTIWSNAAGSWVNYLGDAIFKSSNAGTTWALAFSQTIAAGWSGAPSSWTIPTTASLSNALSGVALDVGWWDTNGFYSLAINQMNSQQIGGSGLEFSYRTLDGTHWFQDFTQFAGTGTPGPETTWKSVGIEMTSAHHPKYSPANSQVVAVGMSDVGGMISQDGGNTWRIIKHAWNCITDLSFDPANPSTLYFTNDAHHDYPGEYFNPQYNNEGGVYKSTDLGKTFTALPAIANDFLSIAYNPINKAIYVGTWGNGVEVSKDGGTTWAYMNSGFPTVAATTAGQNLVINQIEVDPISGNVYAELAGDWPAYALAGQIGIYFLNVETGSTTWQLLRGNLTLPNWPTTGYPDSNQTHFMNYPTRFAIDWTKPENSTTHVRPNIYLVDNTWVPNNTGNATGINAQSTYIHGGLWMTSNGGQNWSQAFYSWEPTDVSINSTGRIYATQGWNNPGSTKWNYSVNGGNGVMYSDNGGTTWNDFSAFAQKGIIDSVQADPGNPSNVLMGTLGAGLVYGPKPPSVATVAAMMKVIKK